MNNTISHHFLDVGGMGGDKIAAVTQNRQKSLIFTVLPKQRKQLKAFSTIYGRKN